jgi:hypothetical protein
MTTFALGLVGLSLTAGGALADPVITYVGDTGFGGPVVFELGGTTPGNTDNNHDQINSSGFIVVLPTATLDIKPWPVTGSFVPSVGDQFEIMTWQTGMFQDTARTTPGGFQNVSVDPLFASNGITFQPVYTNLSGAGNLTLHAIPEPSAMFFGGVVCLCLFGRWSLKRLLKS